MSTAPKSGQEPNPAAIFDALNAYQRSAALKAAIDLNVFTEIARGNRTSGAIAKAVSASVRGIRILCDYLVIGGFLSKAQRPPPAASPFCASSSEDRDQYSLSADAALFLDRNSPAYCGGAANFMLDPRLIAPFLRLPEIVRTGTTTMPDAGTVSLDNPIWIDFATQMAPLVYPAALEVADLVGGEGELRVLDLAAGHGLFGITIAERNPMARVTAVDWADVLAVATANAEKSGVAERHSTLAGDAFQVDFGGPFDLVLVTNFFHHFDVPACEKLMRKILAALAPGGRCVTLDFIPNDDRVSPPGVAGFALMMLGTTAAGDAYTFKEYGDMFRNAGFASSELHPLTKSPQSVVISEKP